MKIMAAMSGGVDSSAAAALLVERGHEVVGATLRLFSGGNLNNSKDIDDARDVCQRLGIEHRVIEAEAAFSREVIGRFASGYAAGITPNPCLDCNRHIKFGLLLDEAKRLGCDRLATGHYARLETDEESGRTLLFKAEDRSKDQSYVLYSLTQDMLAHAIFPLNGMGKEAVRNYASELGLDIADKPDSQDICFVKDGDYTEFLMRECGLKPIPGNFSDRDGNILGTHGGIIGYTVGQRRGLGLSFGRRAYVTGKDAQSNIIIIGENDELYSKEILVKDPNFIPFDRLDGPMKISAKIRYSHAESPAEIIPESGDFVRVIFENPQRAAAPGQGAVFYQGDLIIGGGRII